MYSAIVYSSCTGSGQRYAELISQKLGIPAVPLKKAGYLKDAKVVYIGWLLAGKIKDLKKASKQLNIGAVVQVGMSPVDTSSEASGRKNNNVSADVPFFCVQGGFNMKKLPLRYRPIMKLVNKSIAEKLRAKAELSEQEKATLKMAESGVGEPASWCVDDIVEWCKAH